MKRSSLRVIPLLALLLCVFMLIAQPVMAGRNGFGFGPQLYKSGYTYGNGVYFAPYRFTVHTEPKETAPVVGEFAWSRDTRTNAIQMTTPDGATHFVSADHLFFCFYPELDVAMLAATGDDDDGWVEVVYDQAKQQSGWIKLKSAPGQAKTAGTQSLAPLDKGDPAHFGVYQTWLEFMRLNAKSSGVYWLSGVNEYNRSVRYSDADDAKLIPVTIIRDLKVRHIRGNWLLVEVLDFERNTPIGWVRWRDDGGNLMVFPNISGQHLPIVTTVN